MIPDPDKSTRRTGFTVIELLIVVALLSVVAALFMRQMQPDVASRLHAAAHVISSDLQYVRGLAVGNNSQYRMAFDLSGQQYVLQHTGANAQLDALPVSAFLKDTTGPGGEPQQYSAVQDFPIAGPPVTIDDVTWDSGIGPSAVEFGPLGSLTSPGTLQIWLAGGQGAERRYIAVEVDSATGAVHVGSLSTFKAAVAPVGGEVILPGGP